MSSVYNAPHMTQHIEYNYGPGVGYIRLKNRVRNGSYSRQRGRVSKSIVNIIVWIKREFWIQQIDLTD